MILSIVSGEGGREVASGLAFTPIDALVRDLKVNSIIAGPVKADRDEALQ